MIADERTKRLVEGNNTGFELLFSETFSNVSLNHVGNDSRHSLVEVWVISEKRTNPFGEADDPLAIGHPWQNIIQKELDQFLLPIGMTAET